MVKANANFSFIQKGKGEDLLLLHGYLSSKEAFVSQINYFSKYYRVTAIDFIGFGASPPLTKAFSVGDYAQWLKGVIKLLNLKKPKVIAHSFGCRVAVKLASWDEELFDKIVLTGPAGIIKKRGQRYYFKVGLYRLCRRFFPKFAQKHFGSKEYRSLPPIMQESYKKIVNEDLRETAKKVANEVLIVEGNLDNVTTLYEATVYEKSLKNAKLTMIEGGHFAFVENAVSFNLIVEEFLNGTSCFKNNGQLGM